MIRGSGRTSKQILNTPINGLYLWLNSDTRYPIKLARHLGRTDITFTSLGRIYYQVMGRTVYPVIDHAVMEYGLLPSELFELLEMHKIRWTQTYVR